MVACGPITRLTVAFRGFRKGILAPVATATTLPSRPVLHSISSSWLQRRCRLPG